MKINTKSSLDKSLKQSLSSITDISQFVSQYQSFEFTPELFSLTYDLINSTPIDDLNKIIHNKKLNQSNSLFDSLSKSQIVTDFHKNNYIHFDLKSYYYLDDFKELSKIKLNFDDLDKSDKFLTFIKKDFNTVKRIVNFIINNRQFSTSKFFNNPSEYNYSFRSEDNYSYCNFNKNCFSEDFLISLKDLFDNYDIYLNHPRVGIDKINQSIEIIINQEIKSDNYKSLVLNFDSFSAIQKI